MPHPFFDAPNHTFSILPVSAERAPGRMGGAAGATVDVVEPLISRFGVFLDEIGNNHAADSLFGAP